MNQESHGAGRLSVHIPPSKGGREVLVRLKQLAREKNRSINYLVVQALLAYLQEEDQKNRLGASTTP